MTDQLSSDHAPDSTGPVVPVLSVVVGAATDIGRRRTVNEDAFLAASPLFLVADGMGGHEAGEVASAAVVAEFARLVGRPSLDVDTVRTTFARARRRVAEIDEGGNAGTTLTGAVIAEIDGGAYWLVLNIGDSRTYRLSGGELEQVSVDHSVVQELVDAGQLDPEEAEIDRRRNVITRAIGGGSEADPDFWLIPAETGDRLLVCSDGLSNELDRVRMHDILKTVADPEDAATVLVREAVDHGGRDNVTAVVVDVVAVHAEAPSIDDTVPTGPTDHDTRPREVRAPQTQEAP